MAVCIEKTPATKEAFIEDSEALSIMPDGFVAWTKIDGISHGCMSVLGFVSDSLLVAAFEASLHVHTRRQQVLVYLTNVGTDGDLRWCHHRGCCCHHA